MTSLGSDPNKLTEDANLAKRAAKNKWAVPKAVLKELPAKLAAMFEESDDDRAKTRVAQTLVAMNRQNIDIDQQDDKDDRLDAGKRTENIEHSFNVKFAENRDA